VASKKITEFTTGERLDKAVSLLYPEYSRSSIEKLIESGDIRVNNQSAKTKYRLKVGDSVSFNFHELDRAPDEIDLPIVYEDENVIVINKPIGVLAHSKGNFNKEGTVATFIQPYLNGSKQWKSTNRAGIVHRLDRATSGVMICAKNEATSSFLQKQFSLRNVKKTYLAVISVELAEKSGTIDIPIERNPKKPATFRAGINGKPAQTTFNELQTNHAHSLVELKPRTGRTHQLRVHLAYLKHPIVGDEFYGGEQAERLMLHALELEITLPGGKRAVFTAPKPKVFTSFL
jgi:23S rRNA pseudouridine1911/1915/1917 synthase